MTQATFRETILSSGYQGVTSGIQSSRLLDSMR